MAVRLALAEADDAFGRDGNGVECPLVRIDVKRAHVRTFCIRLAAEIEFETRLMDAIRLGRAAEDEARLLAVPPVFVAEDGGIADLFLGDANPHRGGEVVAVF